MYEVRDDDKYHHEFDHQNAGLIPSHIRKPQQEKQSDGGGAMWTTHHQHWAVWMSEADQAKCETEDRKSVV